MYLGDLGPGSYLPCGGCTWRSWPRFCSTDGSTCSLPSLWWMYLEILAQVLTFLVVDVLRDLGPGSYLPCGGCTWRSWPRFCSTDGVLVAYLPCGGCTWRFWPRFCSTDGVLVPWFWRDPDPPCCSGASSLRAPWSPRNSSRAAQINRNVTFSFIKTFTGFTSWH